MTQSFVYKVIGDLPFMIGLIYNRSSDLRIRRMISKRGVYKFNVKRIALNYIRSNVNKLLRYCHSWLAR